MAVPPTDLLREGDTVLLRRKEGEALLVTLRRGPQTVEGRGVVDLSGEIGRPPGGSVAWAGATYVLLRPSLADLLQQLRRRAQIITPKDAAQILYLGGIAPGATVAEAGSGSGALTIALAYAVGSGGHIHSYDRRPDFLEVARRNVATAGLGDRVTFSERDVAKEGFDRSGLDAIVLDLAEPWAVTGHAHGALRPGGYLVAYVPTYNQLERTVRAMRETGLEETRALELLERELHVGEGGTRPEFEMLGHTGFLSSGRRVR